MAGIGVKLQKIFDKKSIAAHLVGFVYSTISTVAPMFVVIGNIMLMSYSLGYDTLSYARRGLFSGTILYIFIFSLLTAAPFNAVLSRYMSDVIYEERYDNILSCYYLGLILNIVLSCLFGIPFCIWEYVIGHVHLLFVFTGFCGYISLVLVFYSMLYLSICKDYQKISFYFLLGMVFAFLMSLFLVWGCKRDIAYSMLLALSCGFFLTAVLEAATIKRYFKTNSNCYREVLAYFKKYWQLIVVNFLYTLGLYIHNFVFWNSNLRMVVAGQLRLCTDVRSGNLYCDVHEYFCYDHFYFPRGDALSRTLQSVFRGRHRRALAGYPECEEPHVPAAGGRTFKPRAYPVYHHGCGVSGLCDRASGVWIWWRGLTDLSVSGGRIFCVVFVLCRDYFPVLFQ